MVSKSVAILRFKWKDQANTQPKWPDNAYTGCFLPVRPTGVSRYWQDCTFGLVNLQGSVVFPWRTLGLDMPKKYLARATVLTNAIERGLDEGFPLHDFKHAVVMVIPNVLLSIDHLGNEVWAVDGGAITTINTRGGTWSCALLSETDGHQFFAHEFGHAIGFDHSWGHTGGTLKHYDDPYCVMSAEIYGGTNPVWASDADPYMPVHGDYWKGMAPGPAGATLYKYLPEFTQAGYAVELGSNFASVPRSIRLNALDARRKPCVAVVTMPGSNIKYTVEYRRPKGWDRSLWPAVVIHSIGPTGDKDQPEAAIYEGNIPLSFKGDMDWRSTDKKIAVLLDRVEDDGSAVEVTIGGIGLVETRSAAIDVLEGGSSELAEEGEADVFVPPICGKKRFRFFIDHQQAVIHCIAKAQGFDNPAFSWKVNGIPLSLPESGVSVLVPAVRTPVVAHFPRPDSETTRSLEARLEFSFEDNILELKADHKDGNYQLNVEVTVKETSGGGGQATASANAQVTGVIVRYEKAYYDAVKDCSAMLEGVAHKYAKSRIKVVRKDAPLSRNIAVLENLQRVVEVKNPALAEQIGQAKRALKVEQALEKRDSESETSY